MAWQLSAFRELMYTRAPWARKPAAIISPIPRDPPVTSTVFPATENKFFIFTAPVQRVGSVPGLESVG